jgi:hypothetical protein
MKKIDRGKETRETVGRRETSASVEDSGEQKG